MFSILTWNIANFDDHRDWDMRINHLVKEIIRLKPDIIMLQEVRYNKDRYASSNSGEQILQLMQAEADSFSNYRIYTQPAMYYRGSDFWEGLSIITRYPVQDSSFKRYPIKVASMDSNQRIALYLKLSIDNEDLLVINTHFSYHPLNSKSNIAECLDLANSFGDIPIIITGDFNSTSESQQMSRFRKSKFIDCWPLQHNQAKGYTFPSNKPERRIDYIWITQNLIDLFNSISKVGESVIKDNLFPSDHLGLFAQFSLL